MFKAIFQGKPVAIDGEEMKASDIIRKLNKLGGDNGIGLLDIVENRMTGMKDRGVYLAKIPRLSRRGRRRQSADWRGGIQRGGDEIPPLIKGVPALSAPAPYRADPTG